MKRAEDILIIGGGIIGLFCAWYLRQEGFEVAIIEKDSVEEGCSSGNAGMIVPSHFIPLAAPGVVAKGLKWMLDAESPFYIRPRLNADLLRWGWQFIRNSNPGHVKRSQSVLRDLNMESKRLYQELAQDKRFDFGFEEKGILMLFKTAKSEEEEGKTAELANQLGIEARMLSGKEVAVMEPQTRLEILGAAYYPGDGHLHPDGLIRSLRKNLAEGGVKILDQTLLLNIEHQSGRISSVHTSGGSFFPDQVILAAGSWSGKLAKKLGINLPMQGGKGYSLMTEGKPFHPKIPAILTEAKVTITPMAGKLRFGGTLEISGLDQSVNLRRVKGLLNSIPQYYPELSMELPSDTHEIWRGLRPCSPDGLPYIGYSTRFENLLFATGHAMMGLSLAPVTGKLISQLILGGELAVPLNLLAPERYS